MSLQDDLDKQIEHDMERATMSGFWYGMMGGSILTIIVLALASGG